MKDRSLFDKVDSVIYKALRYISYVATVFLLGIMLMAFINVVLEKLHKLGLYKHLNAQTLGYPGDPAEEADRMENPL